MDGERQNNRVEEIKTSYRGKCYNTDTGINVFSLPLETFISSLLKPQGVVHTVTLADPGNHTRTERIQLTVKTTL